MASNGQLEQPDSAWTLAEFQSDYATRVRAADEATAKLARELAPLAASIMDKFWKLVSEQEIGVLETMDAQNAANSPDCPTPPRR